MEDLRLSTLQVPYKTIKLQLKKAHSARAKKQRRRGRRKKSPNDAMEIIRFHRELQFITVFEEFTNILFTCFLHGGRNSSFGMDQKVWGSPKWVSKDLMDPLRRLVSWGLNVYRASYWTLGRFFQANSDTFKVLVTGTFRWLAWALNSHLCSIELVLKHFPLVSWRNRSLHSCPRLLWLVRLQMKQKLKRLIVHLKEPAQ